MVNVIVLLSAALLASFAGSAAATPQVISLSDYCTPNDGGDDSDCMQLWMSQAAGAGNSGKDFYVPPGVWLYSKRVSLYPNTRIRCAGPGASIFKNNGGNGDLFFTGANVENIIIENCGFDMNGAPKQFMTVIGVNPSPNPNPHARNIHVRGNRIFDTHSAIVGQSSPQQRDAILLVNCDDCWIEGNRLSEGARIKVGRPGRRLFITKNVIENANDNAISAVDPGTPYTSSEIIVEGNVVINPAAAGIFFGGDGESANNPNLAAFNILVSGNHIKGTWASACILGTLPARAGRVHVVQNTCTKSGGPSGAGVQIKRVDPVQLPSQQVLIGSNTIATDSGALDKEFGAIFITGRHTGIRVLGNDVRNVKTTAIHFKNMIIHDALIADNVMADSGLKIDGPFSGIVSGNVVVSAEADGLRFISDTTERITASVSQNLISSASGACIIFQAPGQYHVDLVGNTLGKCAGGPIVGEPSAGSVRIHNKGDVAPHATPTRHFTATRTWTTASIAPGNKTARDVSVAGARPGDIAGASFDAISGDDWQMSAYVTGNDTVRVLITNRTGTAQTLSGTVRVHVWRFN